MAVCRVAAADVNRWMVRQGWALAYPRYSRAYVGEEKAARAARHGIWNGRFVPLRRWRGGERLAGWASNLPVEVGERDCRIKGNVSRKGTRIHHLLGGLCDERTRIDTSRGERWLCSEAEVRVPGWRRSRR